MAPAFGLRLKDCGPNRLAVLARVRQMLGLSPANVKKAIEDGPVTLRVDMGPYTVAELRHDFEEMGANVEIFESSPIEHEHEMPPLKNPRESADGFD
jgi:ribosomal protein L7/L12